MPLLSRRARRFLGRKETWEPAVIQAEIDAFQRLQIGSPTELWAEAGKDPLDGLTPLALATGTGAKRLVDILEEDVEAYPVARAGFLATHWLDLTLAAGAVLLAYLMFDAVRSVRAISAPAARQAVVAARSVPRYVVLTTDDVRRDSTRDTTRTVRTVTDAVGRPTLVDLALGAAVSSRVLGPRVNAAEFAGRSVTRLRLGAELARSGVAPGERVALALSAAGPGAPDGAVLADVLVLATYPADSSALFAIRAADIPAIARLLGGTVTVLHRPPQGQDARPR